MHPHLRLATYNVEWFNALFGDDNRLMNDREPSGRYNVNRADQITALGRVFRAMDADGVMVIEAPDTGSKRNSARALERFAKHFDLRCNRAVTGFMSETEQEITFLYDPDRLTAEHRPEASPEVPRFDMEYAVNFGTDTGVERVRFSKPPLELVVSAHGFGPLHLLGVHLKSKAPHGVSGDAFRRESIRNRRKQLGECQWLRARVDALLARGEGVIVMGDLNDGPGADEYERMFGHSGVEVVAGVDCPDDRRLFDPSLVAPAGQTPTTARFWHGPEKRSFEALLDFILVSAKLKQLSPHWRIWNPNHHPELADDLLTASDHYPVTVDLPLQIARRHTISGS